MTGTPPDRLRRAALVFAGFWLAAALALGGLVAGAQLGNGSDPRPALVETLGLSELILSPAGRPPRLSSPSTLDLRHLPGQPRPPWESRAVGP